MSDVTSMEVAVIVPIQRAGSAVEVDLMPLSKQGQAIGNPCGSAWNGPAGRSGDFSQMIADCGAVDTACSLGRKSQGDDRVVGLFDVGENGQFAVLCR